MEEVYLYKNWEYNFIREDNIEYLDNTRLHKRGFTLTRVSISYYITIKVSCLKDFFEVIVSVSVECSL